MRTTSLLAARKRRNLTGEQLARLVGVNRGTISRLERGLTQPMHETARRLEKVLGCSLRFQSKTAA